MGNPSSLRLVPVSSASTPIDWTHVPEATKKEFILDYWGYNWEDDGVERLPATVGDLAKMFDDSKFFGYLGPSLCQILMQISEFGLKAQESESGVPPRFYMEYLYEVWFMLFLPGKRDSIWGHSHSIIRSDYDEADSEGEDQRRIAEEIKLAEQFDLKLMQELSHGVGAADIVDITNMLSGWEAWRISTVPGCSYSRVRPASGISSLGLV